MIGVGLLAACEPLPGAGPAVAEDEGVRAYSLRGVSPEKPRGEYRILRGEDGGFRIVRAAEAPEPETDTASGSEVAAAPDAAPVVDTASKPIADAPSVSAEDVGGALAVSTPVTAAEPPAVGERQIANAPTAVLGAASKRLRDPLRQKAGDAVLDVQNLPAYWDGDATTGGLWIALPNLRAHQRVVVTNPETGKQVVAKLFWRDPETEGGSTLLSSQAASALDVGQGQLTNLDVKIIKVE